MPTTTQVRTTAVHPAGWSGNVALSQTDPASGIASLTLGLTGYLNSDVAVESLEAAASTFSSSDAASITVERPDGSAWLTATPRTFITTQLGAYDGAVDFAGASGRALSGFGTNSSNVTYVPGPASSADAALLVGTGTVTLPLVSGARVSASGPGNFTALLHSYISAELSTVADTALPNGQGSSSVSGGVVATIVTNSVNSASWVSSSAQTAVLADTTTGWTSALNIDGFDCRLGTLERVQVTINADARASYAAENLDPAAGSVTVGKSATLSIVDASGTALSGSTVALSSTCSLGAFDGAIDDAGSSGVAVTDLSGSAATSETLSSAADLAGFTGTGRVPLSVVGTGATTVDGPGNMQVATWLAAGATISVSYTYQPAQDPLFDRNYYLAHNADVAAAGVDPWTHFLTYGAPEGRSPDAWFDPHYYLAQNPDVTASGMDPLLHFEEFGWREGRDPSLLFSDSKYLAANPDVAAAGIDPLQHDIEFGQHEGRATFLTGGAAPADPLVNAAYYDQQLGATLIPNSLAAAQQAAWSYDHGGWQKGLNPDALFDTQYYLSHNPDVAAAHIDPLLHYETYGWKEGRDPSAAFSTSKYLAAYSDVKAARIDPLLHFVQFGQAEGRAAFAA